jgi:hypothetical protein
MCSLSLCSYLSWKCDSGGRVIYTAGLYKDNPDPKIYYNIPFQFDLFDFFFTTSLRVYQSIHRHLKTKQRDTDRHAPSRPE